MTIWYLKPVRKITRRKPLTPRQARLDAIDRAATRLYDRLNPNWNVRINVSKAECIRRVERRLSR